MVKNITIENFKSIEKIKFNFDSAENITCLIGKNGSGKTNIFRAIVYFFRQINKSFSDEKIIDNSNPYIQSCSISIVFDLKLLSQKAKQNPQLNDKFRVIDDYIEKMVYDRSDDSKLLELKMTQFKDGSIKWNIEDVQIRNTIKTVFPIYFIDTRRLDLYTWDKLWEIISDLASTKPSENGADILDNAFMNLYGDKYISCKETVEKAFEACGISLDRYNFESRYKNAYSMRFGGERFMVDGHSLDYYSDGTSSFTYLKLLTILIPQISENSCKFPLLLIDEPEIGLHNTFISEYVECLYESIKNKAFCMLNTHSPKLIADLCNNGSSYTMYKINKKGFYSVANKMNTSWLEETKHRVTVKETECYFSDNLVYVEGETEVQLFSHPKILELFGKLKQVHFYSFDGNEERLNCVKVDKLNLGNKFYMLLDMDKIITYIKKEEKFSLNKDGVNPLYINEHKVSKNERRYPLEYRFYNKDKQDMAALKRETEQFFKTKFPTGNKYYINDLFFDYYISAITELCLFYKVLINYTTIEGEVITDENMDLFIKFLGEKNLIKKAHKQHNSLLAETDIKQRNVLLLCECNGKPINSASNKNIIYSGKQKVMSIFGKTDGWMKEWINYYFNEKIDSLETIDKKREEFKKAFPHLFNTLQIIESMV